MFYDFNWLNDMRLSSNTFRYTLSGTVHKVDLTPYLEEIYAQAGKGKNRYDDNQKPFVIELEDSKLIFTMLHGTMFESGRIDLESYVDGYLLVK